MKCALPLLAFITVLLFGCGQKALIQTGSEAYKYRHYTMAIDMLTEEIEQSKDNAEKAKKSYWVAESYRWQTRYDESLPWYRRAFELEQNRISLEAYAYALLRSQQYTSAEQLFVKLEQDYGRDPHWTLGRQSAIYAKKRISEQQPGRYIVRRRAESSRGADFAVMDADDGFVISSDRGEAIGETYHWTGQQHYDLFYTGSDPTLIALLAVANTPLNEANLTIDPLGSRAVWTSCGALDGVADVERCQLMTSVLVAPETWSVPSKLPFCKDNYSYGHATWSPDGRYLVFASDQPGGAGGHDLYITGLTDDDQWWTPRPWSALNTVSDDVFPTWSGDTLYWATDGRVGMGGLDLYRVAVVDSVVAARPEHLPPPINSGADDFGIWPLDPPAGSDVIHSYVLSSNRKGSQLDDLYQFDELRLATDPPPPPPPVVQRATIVVEVYRREGGSTLVPMPTAVLQRSDQDAAIPLDETTSSASIEVEAVGRYGFTVNAPDHFSAKGSVRVTEVDEDNSNTYLLKLVLEPIEYGREIVLEDIYYDFDKWDIREDAKPALDSLVTLLSDNPRLSIELSSHTDCRGLDIYNTELSQLRAQSAVTYIVSRGIGIQRLTAVGYGERQPRVPCICEDCTEEEHQENRRTAFKVLR